MFALKIALLLLILAAGFAGGALPLLRSRVAGSERLLGWGNAFAAGVFLAAGMVHMLPDADETWQSLGFGYPVAFVLATFAFLFMLLVEHVLPPEHAHEEVHAPSGERFASLPEHAHDQPHDAMPVYAVLTALSIHALLAGLALGTTPEASHALVLSIAIIAHKSAEGFALGVSLARSPLSRTQCWTLVALFAIATPVGGLLGTVLGAMTDGPLASTLEAIFVSIAAGTFVYVATFDILRDEFPAPGGRLAKWAVLVSGVAAMSALAIWA